jgi:hypothetical protein
MDGYFHLTASFWRSEDGSQWSATFHPYVPDTEGEQDVRFHGTKDVSFHDAHNMSGTLRSIWTDLLIRHAGVHLELF